MKYKEKVIKRIIEHIKANYQRIDKDQMKIGDSFYNYMCHMNAVQYIKNGKADEIYLCVYIENNWPIVHFINKQDDKYIDNTLGWRYEQLEYYIIKKVSEDEYNSIEDLLSNTQKSLVESNSNVIARKIFRINSSGGHGLI